MLEKEVNIDFCCSMNRIIFDKTVSEDQVTFAFVTLPDRDVKDTPERGQIRHILRTLKLGVCEIIRGFFPLFLHFYFVSFLFHFSFFLSVISFFFVFFLFFSLTLKP